MVSTLSLPRALNSETHIVLVEKFKAMMGIDQKIARAMIRARRANRPLNVDTIQAISEETQRQAEFIISVTFDAALAVLLGVVGQSPKSVTFEIHVEEGGRVTVIDGDISNRLASGKAKTDFRSDIKHAITPVLEQFFANHKVPRSSDLAKMVEKSMSLQFSNILLDQRLNINSVSDRTKIKCVRK